MTDDGVLSPSRRRWVLVLAAVAALMTSLDTLAVSTALSSIQRDLDAGVDQLEWTVNAYNLVMAVLLMPAAALGDRFGRRRMFAAGLVLFTGSSVVCAVAPDAAVLVVGRAGQGAGSAFVTALGLTLVSAAFPPDRRGAAIGFLQAGAGIAVLAGPALGGVVTHLVGWEAIFWLNVPTGLVLLPLILRKSRESFGPATALDVPGVLLVGGAVLGAMWGLSRGNVVGWTQPDVLGGLVAAAVLGAAFVAWERRRAGAPILPPHLLRNRGFVAGNLAMGAVFVQIFAGLFLFAQFLQTGLGLDPMLAGLALMPWTSSLIVVGPVAGRLADRFGPRPPAVAGLVLLVVGFAWVGLVARAGMPYGELVVPLLVTSVGASLSMAPLTTGVLASVAPAEVGTASGVNSMVRELGGVLGLAVVVAVFTGSGGGFGSPESFVAGFRPAVLAGAVLVACGAVAALFLPGARPDVTPAVPTLSHTST